MKGKYGDVRKYLMNKHSSVNADPVERHPVFNLVCCRVSNSDQRKIDTK